MPLHDYRCASCDEVTERFVKMADLDLPQRCHCGLTLQRLISAPFVRGDLPGYTSPVDGRWIEGRSQRREDLRRNHCVEYDPGMKTEAERRRVSQDNQLEKDVENTLDAEISKMPARKRELLEQEVRAGASAELVRMTPGH